LSKDFGLGTGSSSSVLAAHVEGDGSTILLEYEHALQQIDSPILRDSVSRRQAMTDAQHIISDVVTSLRMGRVHVDEAYRLVAWVVGASEGKMHPRESLRAAAVLFDVALEAATRYLGAVDEPHRLLKLVALALNESISLRVREAAGAHPGYLLNKINEAYVGERQRIARELHDRIGHGLSIAHRELELFDLYWETDPVKAAHRANTARRAIQETMESLRVITTSLRLEEPLRSLEEALATYLDSVSAPEVSMRLRVNGDETWASADVRDESFFVLREAIHNALTHGHPTVILVDVDVAPHELRARVEDDGSGFDHNRIPVSGGQGLSSMRERAISMGGSVSVVSGPNRGTQIDLLVPLPRQTR
jgi:signal transduction histidine kinase